MPARSQRIRHRPTPTPSGSDSEMSPTPNTTVKNPKLQVSPDVVAANTDNPSVEVSQRQPSKRKLEEPDDSAELPPAKTQETYVKHPDHWAPDGNVLIQLGNTRFSVHQSRLATRSSWFAALFAARSNLPFDSDDADVIEHVLKSVEVVNGLDLFYLDDSGAPNAEEFAALLTAMDVAIGYVYDRPPFDVVKKILIAADFYGFDQFVKFATNCMKAFFPQNVEDVTSSAIPNSIEAIALARDYNIAAVLPAAFYQLARTTLVNSNELEKLKHRDLVLVSNFQKKVALFWDDIFETVGHDCRVAKCVMFHTQHVHSIKKIYPLDPIMGMHKLIEYNWIAAKEYCPTASKDVVNKLKMGRLQFWDKMKVWLR